MTIIYFAVDILSSLVLVRIPVIQMHLFEQSFSFFFSSPFLILLLSYMKSIETVPSNTFKNKNFSKILSALDALFFKKNPTLRRTVKDFFLKF